MPESGLLKAIDDRNYVLTLDYALKMLNIHERYECGFPVIIEGETGVGKTALIGMLSQLWKSHWTDKWELEKARMLLDVIKEKIESKKFTKCKIMVAWFL